MARGFTLAESLVASAILAVSAVAIVGPIMASRQQAERSEAHADALALARQLLEEIASRPFVDPDGTTVPGPEADEAGRAMFDNVDDYHGYSDTSAGLTMVDGTPVTIPGAIGYARSVTVEYRRSLNGEAAVSGDFALVTVTVTPSEGPAVRLSQMMTRIPLKR